MPCGYVEEEGSGIRISKDKGPQAGLSLACWRNSKEVSETRVKYIGNSGRREARESLQDHGKILDFNVILYSVNHNYKLF